MKAYELYDNMGRPTCLSKFETSNGIVWMVLASSIKQAYYCASRNIWSNGVKVGILGTRKGEMKDGEAIWKYFDGHTSHNKEYSHMQTIKVK